MDTTRLAMKTYLNHTHMEHKEYQYEGVEWCVNREKVSSSCSRGGLLADEMGLGKTIIMIGTFLANIVRNTLIVVPTILIDQWYTQIYKTTGHRPLIYHASNKQYKKKDITVEMLAKSRIVITTYAAIAVNKNKNTQLTSRIHEVAWSRVVFDEAHHLRNTNSRHNGATMLKADIRWIISGTPVQNKRQDFYNL